MNFCALNILHHMEMILLHGAYYPTLQFILLTSLREYLFSTSSPFKATQLRILDTVSAMYL